MFDTDAIPIQAKGHPHAYHARKNELIFGNRGSRRNMGVWPMSYRTRPNVSVEYPPYYDHGEACRSYAVERGLYFESPQSQEHPRASCQIFDDSSRKLAYDCPVCKLNRGIAMAKERAVTLDNEIAQTIGHERWNDWLTFVEQSGRAKCETNQGGHRGRPDGEAIDLARLLRTVPAEQATCTAIAHQYFDAEKTTKQQGALVLESLRQLVKRGRVLETKRDNIVYYSKNASEDFGE
jgi:hypothetical protein